MNTLFIFHTTDKVILKPHCCTPTSLSVIISCISVCLNLLDFFSPSLNGLDEISQLSMFNPHITDSRVKILPMHLYFFVISYISVHLFVSLSIMLYWIFYDYIFCKCKARLMHIECFKKEKNWSNSKEKLLH